MAEDLVALAQMACEVAVKEGAQQADASARRGHNLEVEIERDAIKSSDASWGSGVSVRALYKGGTGWASASGLDEDLVRETAAKAAEMSKVAEPDPDFVSLPEPAEYQQVEGLYDPKVADLGIEQVIGWALAGVDEAKAVDGNMIVAGGAGVSSWERALVNSLGVETYLRASSVGMSLFAIIKRGDDVGSYYDFDNGRVLSDFAVEGLGTKVAEQALSFLGARLVPTATLPVVFGPLSSYSLIRSLCSNANAEDIQRKRSYLVGMKGKRVASSLLSITDEPFIPRGFGSGPHDSEGFPHRPLTIVEEGVLKTYLHNSYTAGKAKEPNTGHSTRGGISPTNTIPKLGTATSDEIIADTDDGIYLNMGSVSPNPVTGEISATVDFGFKIENGKLAYPVKSTMLGINMLELLQNVDAISSDYREEPGMVMPTLRAQGVKVAGGA